VDASAFGPLYSFSSQFQIPNVCNLRLDKPHMQPLYEEVSQLPKAFLMAALKSA
jgi:hypothetical protein